MAYLFIILLCILLFLLISFPKHLRRTRAKNPPPGPLGLPLFGSLLHLGRCPHQTLAQWAHLYGPLMTVHFGLNPTIIASSAELAKEILHKNDQNFSNRPIPDVVGSQPNCDGTLAWVHGDQRWRNRRRVCTTQLFTTQRLDSLQHLRHQKVDQLIARIKFCCDQDMAVDIGKLAFATTLNLISNTVFSVDIVDPKFESAGEFKDLVWRIMEFAGKPNVSDYFPVLKRFDLQGIRRHVMQSYVRLHEIFDELIDERLRDRNSGSRAGDFLDVLLDQNQGNNGSEFSREMIKPLILDLFIAGSDTSGITTEWAMAELLINHDVMQKAKKELAQVMGNETLLKESDTDKLPYIQAIIKETLRLHPPAPLLLPYIAGDDTKVDGFNVLKGDHVLINAWAIGRDPEYWDDPLSFKPERFLNSNLDYKGRDFEYIPFGAGRRICPGLPLANRIVPIMLASIIHSFNWKLPTGISTNNLDMQEEFGITLKKATPLVAIPVQKSSQI